MSELQTVFVTGASSGIGSAVARRFAGAGSRVVLAARRKDRLDALAHELGPHATALELDVTNRKAVERAVRDLPPPFARVDVLVNNAGGAHGIEKAQDADVDDWDAMIDVNIKGLLYVTRAILPSMVERDHGHIINIGSVAGTYPYVGGNVYAGTKAFVAQLSLDLRADLTGKNVRITSVEPGMVEDTEFSLVRHKGNAERANATYKGFPPLRAEDIADAVFYCASAPKHVNVNRIELMSVMQSFAGFAVSRS